MAGGITLEQLAAQVVKLGDEIQQLRLDNATLKGQVEGLKAKGSGGGGSGAKSALRDLKKLYPDKFNPKTDSFVTWSEDFLRWVTAESEDLATALSRSATKDEKIPMFSGAEAHFIPDVRFAWLHLKRLMGDKESGEIVRSTPEDNAFEAFRLLSARYAPRSNKVRSKRLRAITNSGEKFANSKLSRVAQLIRDFEELNRRYHEDYKVHPLTPELTIDALKSIIPQEVEHAINLNLLGNKAVLTYAELKKLILEHVDEEQPVPMDVGAVGEQGREEADAPKQEYVDVNSLGTAVGVGKGKGKGKGGDAPKGGAGWGDLNVIHYF